MTVAVYVSRKKDATDLIPWGLRFARADHTDLLIITCRRSKGKVRWEDHVTSKREEGTLNSAVFEAVEGLDQEHIVLKQDIAAGVASSDLDRVAIEIKQFSAPIPDAAIASELAKLGLACLLLPADEPSKSGTQHSSASPITLFGNLPCDTWLIRGRAPEEKQPIRILLATHGHSDIDRELKRAAPVGSNL